MQRKLIRIFLQTSIGFGLLMMIFDFVVYGDINIVSNLISGIGFGIFMTGILGYWNKKSVKRKSSADSTNDYDVKQTKEINLPVPYDKAFELCIESVNQLKKPKIKEKNYSGGVITAKTGITWDTFGDTVSFKLTETKDYTHIVVSSKPVFFQVVDYGKNLENVNNIVSFLEEQET